MVSLHRNTSNGQSMDVAVYRKATQYSLGLWSGMAVVEAWPVLNACATSRSGQTWMPLPNPLHTPRTPPSGATLHSVGIPSHSSVAHRMHWKVSHRWAQDDTPLPLYFTC